MTYVNVEIGYAAGAVFGGSTIEILLSGVIFLTVSMAALICFEPGSWYLPALFLTEKKLKWPFVAKATSAYVMPPVVRDSTAETPDEPRPPTPAGKLTCVPTPIFDLNAVLTFAR